MGLRPRERGDGLLRARRGRTRSLLSRRATPTTAKPPGQRPAPGQVVEGRDELPTRQVTGRAEDDDRAGIDRAVFHEAMTKRIGGDELGHRAPSIVLERTLRDESWCLRFQVRGRSCESANILRRGFWDMWNSRSPRAYSSWRSRPYRSTPDLTRATSLVSFRRETIGYGILVDSKRNRTQSSSATAVAKASSRRDARFILTQALELAAVRPTEGPGQSTKGRSQLRRNQTRLLAVVPTNENLERWLGVGAVGIAGIEPATTNDKNPQASDDVERGTAGPGPGFGPRTRGPSDEPRYKPRPPARRSRRDGPEARQRDRTEGRQGRALGGDGARVHERRGARRRPQRRPCHARQAPGGPPSRPGAGKGVDVEAVPVAPRARSVRPGPSRALPTRAWPSKITIFRGALVEHAREHLEDVGPSRWRSGGAAQAGRAA